MHYQEFVPKHFNPANAELIRQAGVICEEYTKAGYKLTLRQLYYQFVSRDLIANKQQEYNRLGRVMADARLAGLIPWDVMEDRGRNRIVPSTWYSPGDIISACASSYKRDLWSTQSRHVEVWVEKEALVGVLEPICAQLRVPVLACKGYMSLSEMYDSGRRFHDMDKRPVVIHLGDHDPSGIDMTRDIQARLSLLAEQDIEVNRIALTMDQVDEYGPPPNPAKLTDARATGYVAQYGSSSWELDALTPQVLTALVEDTVALYRDDDLYHIEMKRELQERGVLAEMSLKYRDIQEFLSQL